MFGCFRAGRYSVTVAAGITLAAAMGMSAQAQEAAGACGCSTSLPQAGQVVGQLVAASGMVNVLGASGWSDAAAGTPIFVGSRIETGAGSSASIQVGNCALPVGEQSQVSVRQVEQGVCVAVETTQPSFEYGQTTSPASPPVGLPEALFVGTAGGIGATSAVVSKTNDDRRVSP